MKIFLLASTAMAIALPAMAADLPSRASPPPAPLTPLAYDWTGLYFGGRIGWDWGSSSSTVTNSTTGAFVGSGSSTGNSFAGGGQIGYDFMLPSRLVLGVQAAANWHPNASGTLTNPEGTFEVSRTATDRFSGNVNARFGYAFGDLLPYVTGGWAWADGTVSRTQTLGTVGLATPGTSEQASIFRNGWDIGAGLEYRVWGNWSIFGEYLHSSYARASYTFPLAERTTSFTSSADSVAAGVNYKF